MFRLMAISAALSLSACATIGSPPNDAPEPAAYGAPVALGEWVWLNEPFTRLRADEVLEDSRCPPNARCVWAGQVKLKISLAVEPQPISVRHNGAEYDAGTMERELATGENLDMFGGNIAIQTVEPSPAMTNESIAPESYRFSFSFTPQE